MDNQIEEVQNPKPQGYQKHKGLPSGCLGKVVTEVSELEQHLPLVTGSYTQALLLLPLDGDAPFYGLPFLEQAPPAQK